MRERERTILKNIRTVLSILIGLLVLIGMAGCRIVKHVELEKTLTDTVSVTSSIFEKKQEKTTQENFEKIKEKTTVTVNQYHDTLRTDREIIYLRDRKEGREIEGLIVKADTVIETRIEIKEIPIEVEKELSLCQRFLIGAFPYLVLVIGVLLLIIKIRKI